MEYIIIGLLFSGILFFTTRADIKYHNKADNLMNKIDNGKVVKVKKNKC